MEQGFIDILKQLVAEQTSAALTDARRCRALLADYAKNEYQKERRLIVLAVGAGVAKKIGKATAAGLADCKSAQIRELEEEYDLNPASAANIVNVLALVLLGDTTVTVSSTAEKGTLKPIVVAPVEKPSVVSAQDSTFTDPRDGQVYRTVKIGGMIWMAENLNYNTEDSWCYDNDELSGKKYGRLYTWDAAKAACPEGWHLPSRGEWDSLVEAVGGENIAGEKLKSKVGWNDRKDGTSGNGTDEFGFSALPGGYRNYYDGTFGYACENGYWWGATEAESGRAYNWRMSYNDNYVNEYNNPHSYGFSARYVAYDC